MPAGVVRNMCKRISAAVYYTNTRERERERERITSDWCKSHTLPDLQKSARSVKITMMMRMLMTNNCVLEGQYYNIHIRHVLC